MSPQRITGFHVVISLPNTPGDVGNGKEKALSWEACTASVCRQGRVSEGLCAKKK